MTDVYSLINKRGKRAKPTIRSLQLQLQEANEQVGIAKTTPKPTTVEVEAAQAALMKVNSYLSADNMVIALTAAASVHSPAVTEEEIVRVCVDMKYQLVERKWTITKNGHDELLPLFRKAILDLLSTKSLPSAPTGWKLVPVEPTQEMVDAASRIRSFGTSIYQYWHVMLAAAP